MGKILVNNRWLVWAVVVAVLTAIYLLWQIELFSISIDTEIVNNTTVLVVRIPLRP